MLRTMKYSFGVVNQLKRNENKTVTVDPNVPTCSLHQVIRQTRESWTRPANHPPLFPSIHSGTIFFDSKHVSKEVRKLTLWAWLYCTKLWFLAGKLKRIVHLVTVTQSTIFMNIPTEPFIAIPRINIVQVVFLFLLWFCGLDTKVSFISEKPLVFYK